MLPSPQSELAQAITKDNYDFGFVELPRHYIEEELEDELEKHLTRFLLELGTGFAYMGRQKQLSNFLSKGYITKDPDSRSYRVIALSTTK